MFVTPVRNIYGNYMRSGDKEMEIDSPNSDFDCEVDISVSDNDDIE